jgi:hypothetical protein
LVLEKFLSNFLREFIENSGRRNIIEIKRKKPMNLFLILLLSALGPLGASAGGTRVNQATMVLEAQIYDANPERSKDASVFVGETNVIAFLLNHKEVDCVAPPVIIDGRLLLSARDVSESFRKEINWNPTERSISIGWEDKIFKAYIGVKEIESKGVRKTIDVPPTIINGYTMLPARVIVEELGGKINWFDDIKTASVNYYFGTEPIFSDFYNEKKAKTFQIKREAGSGREKIMFWSSSDLSEFKINSVDYLDMSRSETEYYARELKSGELFIYNAEIPEGIPTQTVSYINPKGTEENYWISYDGNTGGIALLEID